jgi:hypothetical protein
MFVRGSGFSDEHKRDDNSFYRGIVVKNNDPEGLNRVKIYISELSNQPTDKWFDDYKEFSLKTIGDNKNLDAKSNGNRQQGKDKIGSWKDIQTFEKICKLLPWAEPCYPLLGESGNFRYIKDGKISSISDANYANSKTPEDKNSGKRESFYGFLQIDSDAPSPDTGVFPPAFLYEHSDTVIQDAFSDPIKSYSVQCNPYSYSYSPSKHSNNTKGVIGVPEVGSKVWVFHDSGDLNFPIYFGVTQDGRSIDALTTHKGSDFEN